MRVIAVINQKGGVGKTTTACNLAHALAMGRRRVLAIDMDPQAHMGAAFGVPPGAPDGVDEVFRSGRQLAELQRPIRTNLNLVPAGQELADVELHAEYVNQGGGALRRHAEGLDADFVIIDCPPSAGFLVMNALVFADEVLVPVAADYLALRGLAYLSDRLKAFDHAAGTDTEQWIAVTRYHSRRRLAQEVIDMLKSHFPKRVLQTPIRECVALAEAPSFGQSIFEYRPRSNGAGDYLALSQDLLKKRVMK